MLNTILSVAPDLVFDPIFAATSGDKLASAVTKFVGPLLLLAMGLAAMTFLFQQQITRFLQFLALAVGVALMFYFPDVTKNVAELLEKALS